MSFLKLIEVSACIVIVCMSTSCATPRYSYLSFAAGAKERISGFTPVPDDWDGRLFRVGDSKIAELGGAATHVHGLEHVHRAFSSPAVGKEHPLGIKETGAKASHVHKVQSYSVSVSTTGSAPNLPPCCCLLTLESTRAHIFPKAGEVVAYIGAKIPKYWVVCDGTNGTPNLLSRYICISCKDLGAPLMGKQLHQHDASHSHGWTSAEPDPNNDANWGFVHHPGVSVPNLVDFAQLAHNHEATEVKKWIGKSEMSEALPISLAVRYIMATSKARFMPEGALLPFVGEHVPIGWSIWKSMSGKPVVGRYLIGCGETDEIGKRVGSEFHTHIVPHTHTVNLAPNEGTAIEDHKHQGPEMATMGHTHTVMISDTIELQPANHDPLFVKTRFIIKQ